MGCRLHCIAVTLLESTVNILPVIFSLFNLGIDDNNPSFYQINPPLPLKSP